MVHFSSYLIFCLSCFQFDIANFELFSNLPKDIHVLGSHRYPSRDWTPLARARGQEGNRAVQSFPINETEDFFKYIKVTMSPWCITCTMLEVFSI